MRFVLLLILSLLIIGCGNRLVNDVYESGQAKANGALKGGKQDGHWQYFYPDGTLKSEGAWLKDYQDGPWTYYYQNGKKKQEGSYQSKHRHGPWTYWYENGKIYCRGFYDNDRQAGVWLYFRESGSSFSLGTFNNAGLKHGVWQWYDNKAKSTDGGVFYNGERIGPWVIDGKAVDKGIPESMLLKEEQRGNTSYYALLEDGGKEANKLLLSFTKQDGQVRSSYDPIEQRYVRLDELGHISAIQEGESLTLWHKNGTLAYDFKHDQAYLDNGTPIPDLAIAANGPGKTVVDLMDAVKSELPGMTKIPAAVVKTQESAPELVISKTNEPALTPVVHIDSLWTKREEKKVGRLVDLYTSSLPVRNEYSDSFAERKMQGAWMGKALPQTRFFTYDGSIIDLDELKGKQSATVIVMRGFAGQVCVYCSTQTRVLAEQIKKFQELDNKVLIVYPGPAETIPMFMKAVKSVGGDAKGIDIVLDVNLGLVRALDVTKDLSKPCSIILDKSGKVIYGYAGKNMGDRPSVRELLMYVKKAQ